MGVQHGSNTTRVRNMSALNSGVSDGGPGGISDAGAVVSSSERIGGVLGSGIGAGAVQRMESNKRGEKMKGKNKAVVTLSVHFGMHGVHSGMHFGMH
eukprot:803164-Pelagomonas_calceolata.AAC.1